MSTDTRTAPVIAPLIPTKPRLRFMADPPAGAAGDPPAAPAGEQPPASDPKPPWG